MKDLTKSELGNFQLPYYSEKFKILREAMEKRIDEFCNNEELFNYYKHAEIDTIIEGIKYYYNVITEDKNLTEKAKQILCLRLIEEMNKSIYIISNDGRSRSDDITNKYLDAYNQFLQNIGNEFRKEQEKKNIKSPQILFSFSFDLLQSKAMMYSLFVPISDSSVAENSRILCPVFVPSDIDIDNVVKYLPMLTHEVSHNFRYSDRDERNRFVLDYLLDNVCVHIVKKLLLKVSEGNNIMNLGKAEIILADCIKNVISESVSDTLPNLISEGHLDDLPAKIAHIISSKNREYVELEEFYDKNQNPYDILKQAFLRLITFTDMQWYITEKQDISNKKDGEIIASLILDTFAQMDSLKIRQKYKDISLEDDDLKKKIGKLLECDEMKIDLLLIEKARDELFFLILEKLKKDFYLLGKEGFNNKDLRDDVLLSIPKNYSKFRKELQQVIDDTKNEYRYIMYDFVDQCIIVKNYFDNITYVCSIVSNPVKKQNAQNDIAIAIFKKLNQTVKESLNCQDNKPYFSSRDIHSNVIRLGLLNDKEQPDVFVKQYLDIINQWGTENIKFLLEEYLQVYREIYADLSMCAVFGFNQRGYFNYVIEQFKSVRQFESKVLKNMTLERIHTVCRVLEKVYKKEIICEMQNNDFKEKDEWEQIWKSYENEDYSSKYDKQYSTVYYEKILTSEWVQHLRENIVVKRIGRYYNQDRKSLVNKKYIENISSLFVREYNKAHQDCISRCENSNVDPISIILEEE